MEIGEHLASRNSKGLLSFSFKRTPLRFFPVRLDKVEFPNIAYNGTALRDLHCLDLWGDNLLGRYEAFFLALGVEEPRIPRPPASKLTLRVINTRPDTWRANSVDGIEIVFDSGQKHRIKFGETRVFLLAPGCITLQAFVLWRELEEMNSGAHSTNRLFEVFSKSNPLEIELKPFMNRSYVVSCINWTDVAGSLITTTARLILRKIGLIPDPDDKSTWVVGINLTEA